MFEFVQSRCLRTLRVLLGWVFACGEPCDGHVMGASVTDLSVLVAKHAKKCRRMNKKGGSK